MFSVTWRAKGIFFSFTRLIQTKLQVLQCHLLCGDLWTSLPTCTLLPTLHRYLPRLVSMCTSSQAGDWNSRLFLRHKPVTFSFITPFEQNPDLRDYLYLHLRVQHQFKREIGRDKPAHPSVPSINSALSACLETSSIYLSFVQISLTWNMLQRTTMQSIYVIFALFTLIFNNHWLEVDYITVSSITDHSCVLLCKRANPTLFPGVRTTIR